MKMNTGKIRNKKVGKYDIESLKTINYGYDHEHGITQSDVDMANRYVTLIERTRSNMTPKAGDRLRYTNQYGDFYRYAHVECIHDDECNMCEQPYIPFIGADKENGIWCSTSGGAWSDLKIVQFRYIGKEQKEFCDWGHCGARSNGAVHFFAEVSLWEYIHPDPLFEDYTTEKWRKIYVSEIDEEEKNKYGNNLYLAKEALSCGTGSMAFQTKKEYHQFLNDYKAKVFPGNWYNQSVIFCYRKKEVLVSREEYNVLELPVISMYHNGVRPAKIEYDDQNRIAIIYFVNK